MDALPHTRSCFVCGEANAGGLKLRFETDGQSVRTEFTPHPAHVGFRSVIHGGILTTVLDEIMVWACAVRAKRFAWCVELNVRFLHSAGPGEQLIATAEMTANRRGRIFEAQADLRKAKGEVIATATGKYWPIPESEMKGLAGDLIGDASRVMPT